MEDWKKELDDLLEDYWGYPDGGTEKGFIRGEMGIFELVQQELSKAREEGTFTRKELDYLSWAMNMERFGEDMVGKRPHITADEHDLINNKINGLIASLTNKDKE